ncbi:MAG: dipeptide epimerase [Saprospiraceae bacterium]|nr:MAG: dipeptide epimerase [Saprospiraceae bacterium]
MQLQLHPFQLQLRDAFRIAHGSRTEQPSMVVSLSQNGHTGYGEATATTYYGRTMENLTEKLESVRALIETTELKQPEDFWDLLYPHLEDDPFVLCALDEAAHDLRGRLQGKPVYRLWGLNPEKIPLTNYTIGIASIDEMVAKMNRLPWPIYKIKLGTDHDLEIIENLRQHTDAIFRVDANTAWTPEQTVELSPKLKALNVEFIEQPLLAEDWEGMRYVYQHSALPVVADESCQREPDVARCHQHFHAINIKLMKCGGLTPARRMIAEARKLGMEVMVGCMTESSVGISAIAQLLPLLDYVDMDGALLLSNDPANGVKIEAGKVFLTEDAGTGVSLKNG